MRRPPFGVRWGATAYKRTVTIRRLARALTAASATVLAVAVPSARAFAANTFTATPADPSGMATDGETVPFSGVYASSPGTSVTVYECLASAIGTGTPAVLDYTQCDPNNSVTVPSASNGGSFSGFIVYDMSFTTTQATPVAVNCGATGTTCDVVADVPPGDVEGEQPEDGEDSCTHAFVPPANGTIVKTTNVVGSTVAPGQVITATLTFNSGDYDTTRNKGDDSSNASDCVELNGVPLKVSSGVSWHEKPGPSLGNGSGTSTFTATYTVPATAAGETICDRGVVSGIPSSGKWVDQYSNTVCFTVTTGAVLPESRWPLALPVGGMMAGGSLVWFRRRRAVAETN